MMSLKCVFSIAFLLVLFFFLTCPSGTNAAIIKLNGTLPEGSLIYDWQVSPDSSTVVYSTGPGRYYRNALFSVPAGGGTAVQITPPVTGDERVTAYGISPDSSRVVFLIQANENAPRHLYSVPIGGPYGLAVWLDETIIPKSIPSFSLQTAKRSSIKRYFLLLSTNGDFTVSLLPARPAAASESTTFIWPMSIRVSRFPQTAAGWFTGRLVLRVLMEVRTAMASTVYPSAAAPLPSSA